MLAEGSAAEKCYAVPGSNPGTGISVEAMLLGEPRMQGTVRVFAILIASVLGACGGEAPARRNPVGTSVEAGAAVTGSSSVQTYCTRMAGTPSSWKTALKLLDENIQD